MSKPCRYMQDRLALLVQDDLAAPAARKVRQHLQTCAACRRYLQELKSDDGILTAWVDSLSPQVAHVEQQALTGLQDAHLEPVGRQSNVSDWVLRLSTVAAVLLVGLLVGRAWWQGRRAGYGLPEDRPLPGATPPDQRPDDIRHQPLPIKLPVAMFPGTPRNLMGVPDLEPPRGRDRPPFYAPPDVWNVALGKNVTASDPVPIMGSLEMITDGDKEASDGHYVELGPLLQHVTVDLGAPYELFAIVVWHYHKEPRAYFDLVVQAARGADFADAVALFNNDRDNSVGLGAGKDLHYVETNEGRLIDAKGVRARYVRLFSRGNNDNDMNHYCEVEVYGRPAIEAPPPPAR